MAVICLLGNIIAILSHEQNPEILSIWLIFLVCVRACVCACVRSRASVSVCFDCLSVYIFPLKSKILWYFRNLPNRYIWWIFKSWWTYTKCNFAHYFCQIFGLFIEKIVFWILSRFTTHLQQNTEIWYLSIFYLKKPCQQYST